MIFIALGSSLGNAELIFQSAEKYLSGKGLKIIQKSMILKNPPLGGVAKNEFSNAVWAIDWKEDLDINTPINLLKILQDCEKSHGRFRNKKWEDRTLDLDILMYGDIIMQTKMLTIPHPEIPNRLFVLQPWQEIVDPDFEIPKYGKLKRLLEKL